MAKRRRVGFKQTEELSYDATSSAKQRRRSPRTTIQSEDDELRALDRKRLSATTRDLTRNFSAVGWMIRKHLDYVSTFHFQSRTRDYAFDRRLEQLFDWWTRPENCDIAGRHSLYRLIRLAEQCRTLDGDVFLVQLQDGRLQAIESDRVQSPTGGPGVPKDATFVHGVQIDGAGRTLGYAMHKRAGLGLQFERLVPAQYVIPIGYYDRFDQIRGISRLAACVNAFQDIYENVEYALAKAKVSQLFGLITYRQAPENVGEPEAEDDGSGTYNVNFGKGPFHLDLDDGDEAKILESSTPSTQFQEFTKSMTAMALKGLDIPYSFFDEAHTNYSGARQALLQYEQSVRAKREELIEALDRITTWKLRTWVAAGLIELPRNVKDVRDVAWEWVPMGLPWIDPLKEIQADVAAIQAGLLSRQQALKARGLDFFDTTDQLAMEAEYRQSVGLPGDPMPAAAPATTFPSDEEAPANVRQ